MSNNPEPAMLSVKVKASKTRFEPGYLFYTLGENSQPELHGPIVVMPQTGIAYTKHWSSRPEDQAQWFNAVAEMFAEQKGAYLFPQKVDGNRPEFKFRSLVGALEVLAAQSKKLPRDSPLRAANALMDLKNQEQYLGNVSVEGSLIYGKVSDTAPHDTRLTLVVSQGFGERDWRITGRILEANFDIGAIRGSKELRVALSRFAVSKNMNVIYCAHDDVNPPEKARLHYQTPKFEQHLDMQDEGQAKLVANELASTRTMLTQFTQVYGRIERHLGELRRASEAAFEGRVATHMAAMSS